MYFHNRFSSKMVRGVAALRLEIQYLTALHQDRARPKQGWRCNHAFWSFVDSKPLSRGGG